MFMLLLVCTAYASGMKHKLIQEQGAGLERGGWVGRAGYTSEQITAVRGLFLESLGNLTARKAIYEIVGIRSALITSWAFNIFERHRGNCDLEILGLSRNEVPGVVSQRSRNYSGVFQVII